MHITHEMNMHNCQLCRKEWLGRYFGKKYEIHSSFIRWCFMFLLR